MAAGTRFLGVLVTLALLSAPCGGAQEAPTTPATDAIPRAQLEPVYRHELEGLYQPGDADKVFAAHQLLEQYFASTTAAGRTKLVADLQAIGLDVNLLGRHVEHRLHRDQVWLAEKALGGASRKIGRAHV